MRTITRTVFATAAAVALVGGASMSASAATTGATVEVTAGSLTISAPASVTLGAVAPGATATAVLGSTTVSDLTADTNGWTSTVTVSDFTGTSTSVVIPGGNFSYAATDITPTGTVTATNDAATDTMTADDVVGNNSVTWGAAVDLDIPTDALADTYTGTITSSVS
jgi:hypothetical protein